MEDRCKVAADYFFWIITTYFYAIFGLQYVNHSSAASSADSSADSSAYWCVDWSTDSSAAWCAGSSADMCCAILDISSRQM